MSCYLQPTEYQTCGLPADVTDDWVTAASSLIDAHCRRASLNPTQYTERLRMVEGSQTVRLSHLPLVAVAPATTPFVSIQARYARPRRGEIAYPLQEEVAVGVLAARRVDHARSLHRRLRRRYRRADLPAAASSACLTTRPLLLIPPGSTTLPDARQGRLRADREERPGHARPQREDREDRHPVAAVLLRLARRRHRARRCSKPWVSVRMG